MLAVDSDGLTFVSYRGDLEFTEDEFHRTCGLLERHRNFATRQVGEAGVDLKVAAKAEWVAAYHDWYIRDNVREDLIGDSALLTRRVRSPSVL